MADSVSNVLVNIKTRLDGVKPGWKTSEFWLSLLAQGAGLVAALSSNGAAVQIAGLVVAVLSQLGYTSSRGKAKNLSAEAMRALVEQAKDAKN